LNTSIVGEGVEVKSPSHFYLYRVEKERQKFPHFHLLYKQYI
jgi:hypothetical protein